MLSVIIATDESEQKLLPTLAALVPGSVGGVVREVIIADAGSQDATGEIADAAGCRFLVSRTATGERWRAAAAIARAPWLLFLPPGAVLDPTWIDDAKRFIDQSELRGQATERAAVFRASATEAGVGEALAALASALGLYRRPARGVLIGKLLYDGLARDSGNSKDPGRDLLRALGRRRTVVLRSGAMMAGE